MEQYKSWIQRSSLPNQLRIVVLKGYPSAKWLSIVGALGEIDPEFFRSYLDFNSRTNLFSLPALPSSQAPIKKLSISTVLKFDGELEGHSLKSLRQDATTKSQRYPRTVTPEANTLLGDSMYRGFHVIDENYVVVEQQISILIQGSINNWTGMCDIRLSNANTY